MRNTRVNPEMIVSAIIYRFPQTRHVFDRYGLKGCGGPNGPFETIAWFARLHGVAVERLVDEINEAIEENEPVVQEFRPSLADTIYRPFFIAGILTVMTVGCVWGAVNLLLIGLNMSFTSLDYSWVLAHGHAMVFGFVGFFIMGYAYQAFPRFKHTELQKPGLAYSTLPVMAGGIILQIIAHLFAPHPAFLVLGIASGFLQTVAAGIFAAVLFLTIRQSQKPEPYDRFVYAALCWFFMAALLNPVIFWLFENAATREEFLFRVSTLNIPYRDIQLFGIAVMMILGISIRFLPHAYGLRQPSAGWRAFLFYGVNGALLSSVITLPLIVGFGMRYLTALYAAATVTLLLAAIGSVFQFRLFGPVPPDESDRGLKFIRAAYSWFTLAMAMLVFTPVYNFFIYQPLTGAEAPFSHAYFGAFRHALTVGFIMMMIVGVSSKIVPTLCGVDMKNANSLMTVFVLLNAGNLMRISLQIASDFTPVGFSFIGISGFIEVLGLLLWGYDLVKHIRTGKQHEKPARQEPLPGKAVSISGDMKVSEIIENNPRALYILIRHGFTPLKHPVLRRTLAKAITLKQACRREQLDLDTVLAELRKAIP